MYQLQYDWLYLSSAFVCADCIVRWIPLVEAKYLLTMSDLCSHNLSTVVERVSKNSDRDSHWSRLDDMFIPEPMTVSVWLGLGHVPTTEQVIRPFHQGKLRCGTEKKSNEGRQDAFRFCGD